MLPSEGIYCTVHYRHGGGGKGYVVKFLFKYVIDFCIYFEGYQFEGICTSSFVQDFLCSVSIMTHSLLKLTPIGMHSYSHLFQKFNQMSDLYRFVNGAIILITLKKVSVLL